jgi:uncharacterized membrane protein (DUF4010 family)
VLQVPFHIIEPVTAVEAAKRLAIAALVGLAVGTERERSGHRLGILKRFAGLRTFLLIGLLGGIGGLLAESGLLVVGAILLAGGVAFAVAAYIMATLRTDEPLDGTTEEAALVVLALGVLAGLGQLALAAGAVAVVVLALAEKERLHAFVDRIGDEEMRAALQFAVLALVVLPLLPKGPFPGLGGLKPRELWLVVLFFSALNFAGFLARKLIGAQRGYPVTGLLGGILSSTLVTLRFAEISRREPKHGAALGLGVAAACTVLPLRVTVVSLVLNAPVARALVPYLVPSLVLGIGLLIYSIKRPVQDEARPPMPKSPLRLWSAVEMAIVFQIAMWVVQLTQNAWGRNGVMGSAVVLGAVDADALTVSMNEMLKGGAATVQLAAFAIAVGLVASMVFKLVLSAAVGRGDFRKWAAAGLAGFAVALGVGIWVGRMVRL